MNVRAGIALISMILALGACQPRDAGPASTQEMVSGSSNHTLTVGGRERTFQLYLPPIRPAAGSAPLVVILHGGFGSGSQAAESYGWNAEADRHGFVVAYPDGLNRAWAVGGGCCGGPGRQGVNDVAFVTEMIAAVNRIVPVDAARVYAAGMSNGGMFAYRLACDTTLFAAIGVVAGTLLGECSPSMPVSVIHIHGDADRNVPFDGSPGDGVARIDGPPIAELIAGWRAEARCADPTVAPSGPTTTSIAKCPAGVAVELILVAGAGHQWPGARPKPAAEKALGVDPPSDVLDATSTIWQFFAAHPRTG